MQDMFSLTEVVKYYFIIGFLYIIISSFINGYKIRPVYSPLGILEGIVFWIFDFVYTIGVIVKFISTIVFRLLVKLYKITYLILNRTIKYFQSKINKKVKT